MRTFHPHFLCYPLAKHRKPAQTLPPEARESLTAIFWLFIVVLLLSIFTRFSRRETEMLSTLCSFSWEEATTNADRAEVPGAIFSLVPCRRNMLDDIFSDEQGVLNLESALTNQALENKAFYHLVVDIIHRADMDSLYWLLGERHLIQSIVYYY